VIAGYAFADRDEYALSIAQGRDPRVLIVPPLFDEANRMRRVLVETMRRLDALGVDSLLPDLPGTNESLKPLPECDLATWRAALSAAAAAHGGFSHVAAFRGGALIDHVAGARAIWRLAPVSGADLLRRMLRTKIAADREMGHEQDSAALLAEARRSGLALAGHALSAAMIQGLETARPEAVLPVRTVALQSGGKAANALIPGSPLWLRAEPGDDPELAAAIARDIAAWITA